MIISGISWNLPAASSMLRQLHRPTNTNPTHSPARHHEHIWLESPSGQSVQAAAIGVIAVVAAVAAAVVGLSRSSGSRAVQLLLMSSCCWLSMLLVVASVVFSCSCYYHFLSTMIVTNYSLIFTINWPPPSSIQHFITIKHPQPISSIMNHHH